MQFMKPVIGIAANMFLSSTDLHGLPITYTPHGFVRGLEQAGALPVVIPTSVTENAADYLKELDALVLAGGQDVNPVLYGEEPHAKLGAISPNRDAFELALIEEVWKTKKPLLAVCRGLQLMNVAFGGTLYQDLSQQPDFHLQHVQQSMQNIGVHSISLEPDSWTSNLFGTSTMVNSFHHQAVKTLADPFRAVAWSKDGVIEAVETKEDGRFAVGIQWHPEWMAESNEQMQGLFDAFVKEVKKNK